MPVCAIAAIISIFLFLQSCGNSNTENSVAHITYEQYNTTLQDIPMDSIAGSYLRLDKNRHDFGKVRSRKTQKIEIEFEMENLGKIPLVILRVDVSCGCMSVDYPKTPVFPKKSAKLTITIDTKGQIGIFNRSVFIKSTADNDIVLIRILGEIEK